MNRRDRARLPLDPDTLTRSTSFAADEGVELARLRIFAGNVGVAEASLSEIHGGGFEGTLTRRIINVRTSAAPRVHEALIKAVGDFANKNSFTVLAVNPSAEESAVLPGAVSLISTKGAPLLLRFPQPVER